MREEGKSRHMVDGAMNSFDCAILAPGDERWQGMLARCRHEFYHWPAYVQLEAERMGGEAAALWVGRREGAWLLPVVLRSVADVPGVKPPAGRWRDAVTPYGYPHPLSWVEERDEGEFLERALAALQPFLRRHDVVAVFARCSPLRRLAPAHARHGRVIEHGPCYWIDLSQGIAALNAQMRSRYRSYLNALGREGVSARWVSVADHLPSFTRLYYATMDRVGAAAWYYFEPDYFTGLARVLGRELHLCSVEAAERPLAQGLFASTDGVVQYLFSGAEDGAGQPHATKLMIVFVRDWAKSAGLQVFHLGGGIGARDDALSQFKRGFTRHWSPFRTWRWVVDEERYADLVAGWEGAAGVEADSIEGYFPAYRKVAPRVDAEHAKEGRGA